MEIGTELSVTRNLRHIIDHKKQYTLVDMCLFEGNTQIVFFFFFFNKHDGRAYVKAQ